MPRGEQEFFVAGDCDEHCTALELAHKYPCLRCLSNKQLLAVLLYALTQLMETTVAEALACSACLNCMGKKDKLVALVAIIGEVGLGEDFDIAEMKEQIKCLECSSENQLLSAILYIMCDLFAEFPGNEN